MIEYSSSALAYLGDAVIELLARERAVKSGISDAGVLNKTVSSFVTAGAQSEAEGRIEPLLTEEELDIYKRARNRTPHTVPKNAKVTDYRRATGFEALFAALYLEGKKDRITELFNIAYDIKN